MNHKAAGHGVDEQVMIGGHGIATKLDRFVQNMLPNLFYLLIVVDLVVLSVK